MNRLTKAFSKAVAVSLIALLTFSSTAYAAQTVTYFHNDLLGSPIAATNQNGDVIWRENYQAFGEKVKNDDTAKGNNIGYTGHVNDADTGLTYMQARYYDPVLGRFYANDPVGFQEGTSHSFNRYSYVGNNPYVYNDPNGEWLNFVIGGVVGAVEDLAFQGVMMALGAQDEFSYGSLALSAGAGAASSGLSAVAQGGRLGAAAGKLGQKLFSKGRLFGDFSGMTTKHVLKNIPNGWRRVPADGNGWKLVDENGIERIRFMRPSKDDIPKWERMKNGYWRRQDADANYLDVNGNVVPVDDPDFLFKTHIPYTGIE